jgi:hypothetical protein
MGLVFDFDNLSTHALGTSARSTLHQRLRQHAGKSSGSGGQCFPH